MIKHINKWITTYAVGLLFVCALGMIGAQIYYINQAVSQIAALPVDNTATTPDPSNVTPIEVVETNPITFPQALALLRDPADGLTDLQKTRLGAGVVGKHVVWEGYVKEVTGGSVVPDTVYVYLKPALASEEKIQARFQKIGADLSFFATLTKNQWVSIDCMVVTVESSAFGPYYQLDCQELNLISAEQQTAPSE